MIPIGHLAQSTQRSHEFCRPEISNIDASTKMCAKRTFDAVQINIQKVRATTATLEGELAALTGVCWVATERKKDTTGGWLYTFTRISGVASPFPAVEPIDGYGPERLIEPLGYKKIADIPETVVLPSVEVLKARWNILRADDPNLPELKFLSSGGVLDHEGFIDAWVENDIIISSGVEFLHDHSTHASDVFQAVLQSPSNYRAIKDSRIDKIIARRDKVRAIRDGTGMEKYSITAEQRELLKPHTTILFGIISSIVDALSSGCRTGNRFEEDRYLDLGVLNDTWSNYFISNYGHDEALFSRIWNVFNREIQIIEEDAVKCKFAAELKRWGEESNPAYAELVSYLLSQPHKIRTKFLVFLEELSKTRGFRETPAILASKFWTLIRSTQQSNSMGTLEMKIQTHRVKENLAEIEFDQMYLASQEYKLIKSDNVVMLRSFYLEQGLHNHLFTKRDISIACRAALLSSFGLDLAITLPTVTQWNGVDLDALKEKCVVALNEFARNIDEYLKQKNKLDLTQMQDFERTAETHRLRNRFLSIHIPK